MTLFEEGTREQSASELRAAQDRIRYAIAELINDHTLRVKVLLSLREDYLARLEPLFHLCPRLRDQYLPLGPLSGDQIERAIRGPFDEYPGRYRPELSATLAREIRRQFEARSEGAPIRLTEVQIVCESLFEAGLRRRRSGSLLRPTQGRSRDTRAPFRAGAGLARPGATRSGDRAARAHDHLRRHAQRHLSR